MAELWVKFVQWLTTLDSKKLVIFLLSAIVTLILYDAHLLRQDNESLKEENVRLNSYITLNSDRRDSITQASNEKLQDCNDARLKDIQATNIYWKEKFENLEARLHQEYKTVKKRRLK